MAIKTAGLDRVASTAAIASQAGRPAAAVLTQVRGGIENAAATAVTVTSRGLPVRSDAADRPHPAGLRPAAGVRPAAAVRAGLLTQIITEVC